MKSMNSCLTEKAIPSSANTVPTGTFVCDVCGRVYKYKQNLNTHLESACGKNLSFSCTLCSYRTAIKSHLKRHLVRVHNFNDTQLAAHGLGNS